ncbi:MAG: single-stranded DNA-binding protein [Mycobacteriales bacterium]
MVGTTRSKDRARLRVVKAADVGRRRPAAAPGLNETRLIGRLAAPAETRTLPSGDEVATFRLVVPRRIDRAGERRRQASDTLDCQAWPAPLRSKVGRWQGGEVVEVRGELRRRFWRGAHGPESRCEVEVVSAALRRKAPPVGAGAVAGGER